jgi:hypothetical protein
MRKGKLSDWQFKRPELRISNHQKRQIKKQMLLIKRIYIGSHILGTPELRIIGDSYCSING